MSSEIESNYRLEKAVRLARFARLPSLFSLGVELNSPSSNLVSVSVYGERMVTRPWAHHGHATQKRFWDVTTDRLIVAY